MNQFQSRFNSELLNKPELSDSEILRIAKVVVELAELLDDTYEEGSRLYPYQKEFAVRVVESLILEDTSTITALFSRQSGKSYAIGAVIAACVIIFPELAKVFKDRRIKKWNRGFWVGIFAPSHEQGSETYAKARLRLQSQAAREILTHELGYTLPSKDTLKIRLPNKSRIDELSASEQSQIESKTYHLIVCEEAQDIPDLKAQKSIRPMGAATAATNVYIGTPCPTIGFFYHQIVRNREEQDLNPKGRKNHFEYDYTVCQKFNPAYKKYVENEMKTLGYDSDAFKMAYRLIWLLDQGYFIERTIFDALGVHPTKKTKYYVETSNLSNTHVVGLDVGKDPDSTVVTVLEVDFENPVKIGYEYRFNKWITNWLELEKNDYEDQYYRICEFLDNYKVVTMAMDATGVGDPLYDRFRKNYCMEKGIRVLPILFSLQGKDHVYRYFHEELTSGRFGFPDDARARELRKNTRFKQQFYYLEKEYMGNYMKVHHPEGNYHDDYPDSAALAVWASRDNMLQQIEVTTGNPFVQARTYGRKRVRNLLIGK